MFLIKLPSIVQFEVLSEWISVRELNFFDSAVCNKCDRPNFLKVLKNHRFVIDYEAMTENVMLWVIRRGLRTKTLVYFTSRLSVDWPLIDCSQTEAIIEKVDFFRSNSSSFTKFIAVIKNCPKLNSLTVSIQSTTLLTYIFNNEIPQLWDNITTLHIFDCIDLPKLFVENFTHLYHMSFSMKFDERKEPVASYKFLEILKNCHELLSLRILYARPMGGIQINHKFGTDLAEISPLIRKIEIQRCHTYSTDIINNINTSCVNLTELTMFITNLSLYVHYTTVENMNVGHDFGDKNTEVSTDEETDMSYKSIIINKCSASSQILLETLQFKHNFTHITLKIESVTARRDLMRIIYVLKKCSALRILKFTDMYHNEADIVLLRDLFDHCPNLKIVNGLTAEQVWVENEDFENA